MCRKIVLLISIILLLGLAGNASAVLKGWWKLNDGSGSTVADSSGNGYTGTITGAAWLNDGTRGYVLDFEGADYIAIPSAAVSLTTTVTVSAWVYGDAAFQPQDNSIFEGTRGGNRTLNAHVPWSTGSIFFDAGYATTYDRITKAATSSQYEGQWNHWAFTKDTAAGQMKMYLNGTLWQSGTGKTKTMSGINLFKIGSVAAGTQNYDGMISDFRVYNTVLSASEILALATRYTISGSVGSLDGVTMGGFPATVVTAGGGAFTATVGSGWSGTVTPSKAGYTFSPTNKTYSNVTANQTAQNYTPTQLTYTISGTVGTVDGVTMNGLPGNPSTSGGGNYSATVVYGWSGTATPSKAGYTFNPTNKTYSNVTANQSAQNYTPTLLTRVIYGTVSDIDSMYDMDGITMSGLPGNPVTNSGGYYSATVNYGWNGTVTPSRTGFTFAPTNRTYSNVTVDQNSPYDGTVIRYTLSGYVGTLEGVSFEDLPCSAATDQDGFYTCQIDHGWTGTATPTKEGYTFSPVNKTYSNVTSNKTAQDYTPIINTYTISGHVGSLDGVTMNGLPGNPSTSGGGAYSATVNYGWAGTVTPAKAGYVFDNVYKVYSDIAEDQANQDFTPHQTALDLNMLGWWNFDGSNAADSSGYGHNGTMVGNAVIIDDAERGKVLWLDGAGDYINLGNGSWTNPGNHMSIVAWVKVDLFDVSYQTIIAKGLATYRLGRTSASNRLQAYMNYNAGSYKSATGITNVNDGKWHHTAVTYDGTTMTIYTDGTLEGSSTLSTLYTATSNLCIGRNIDATSRDWQGGIDSVRFYDKALTANEIADIYVAEGSGMIGWWKFDGDAKDSSGGKHDGTMVGDVAIVNDGERGQVLQVSTGADTTDNWVDCGGGSSDRNWATLGDEMSVMAWVKIASFNASSQYIVTKGDSFMVGRYSSVSKLRFKTGHWATENLIGSTASNVADNNWHHVATVYDGAQRYLYIDGQLDAFDNCTGSLLADDYNLLIGGFTGYSDRCWDGYIDDVKLFNRTLSDTEVRVEAGMLTAERPTPVNGATDVRIDQDLDWHAGPLADVVGGQDVYFGTSFDLVNSRDGSVFKGNQTDTTYDPGTLAGLTTYYWAVDTNNDDYQESPWLGEVWNFTTVNDNLVGYWKLNDGSGTTAADSSGFGRNGTITGAAWVNDNIMGQVLDFEGADYITIPSTAFSSINAQITIALWQYGDAVLQPQNNSILYGMNNAGTRVLNVHLPWGSGSIMYDAGCSGAAFDRIEKAANASQYEGQWNHWAFTKDTTTGQMKIYLNGAVWANGTGMTKPMSGITAFKIGSIADGTSNYDGMICEFRVYDEVLSSDQIREIAGLSISSDPLPVHRYIDVDPYPTLTWKSGPLAADTDGHDLYLGTDADLVAARDASVHIGLLDTNSYSPNMLMLATTYYWAVDEVNDSQPLSPWKGDVWRFSVRNSTEGYYKDIFIDSGRGLGGYKASGIPAVGLLGYSNEHIDTSDLASTRKIMLASNSGSWIDDNGVLLYPDGEPRFRLYYSNGGDSTAHFNALEPEGTGIMQAYVNNGGSYTGSCAGAWLSGPHKWGVAPTHLETVGLGTTYTDAIIPDGVTPREIYFQDEWIPAVQLLISPLLRQNYNPALFNDLKIHGIYHNGGCRTDPRRTMYDDAVSWDKERNEALLLFDMSWTLRDVAGAQPKNLLTDPNATETWKMDHNNCMVWAYKGSNESGKVVPCGSHPEHRQIYGEETPLQSAIYQYAYSGFGKATVKAALTDGVARQMNNNATAGHEKIGDRQYHHFTITVPAGADQLQIVLDGNLYDMNLYAKNGDFAFNGEQGVVAATNSTAIDETLTIANPTAGTWYIGVKCNDKVTSTYGGPYYTYTGKFEMLNGLAYTITATVQE